MRMKTYFHFLSILGCLLLILSCSHPQKIADISSNGNILQLADPTIFFDDEDSLYYLYGTCTHSAFGFEVYRSADLTNWEGPCGALDGFVLTRESSYGTHGFWAPQVFKKNNIYYMVYTANEQIAIASATSPVGPFTQDVKAMIPASTKEIDPYIFFDDDGTAYIYHVRLINGNRIYVAKLTDDLLSMCEETAIECITATLPWEDTWSAKATICEGPTVIKRDGLYYMFYSANDFRNPDYAVGYATATSPFGPWEKHDQPMISRHNLGINGTGHGDLFTDANNNLAYVFHTHYNDSIPTPRSTAVVEMQWDKATPVIKPNTFHYLYSQPSLLGQRIEMDVWPNGAPNDNGLTWADEHLVPGGLVGSATAHLTIFPAENPCGKAVLICPGGGYEWLAIENEGYNWVDWYHSQNITCAVLKYRMPRGNYEIPLSDIQEAVRIMRRHADDWGCQQVGVQGASAGGHLVATASTHYEDRWLVKGENICTDVPARPDFQILLYPVISFDSSIGDSGTAHNLLGPTISTTQVHEFSNHLMVTADTPPAFIMLCADDSLVPMANGLIYAQSLNDAGIPVALHVWPSGEHGFGFNDAFYFKPCMKKELSDWLLHDCK